MNTGAQALIQSLRHQGVLRTRKVVNAFEEVDRKKFVLPENEPYAYSDRPLPIGHAQTISQPYTVAFMLELLELKEGQRVLDVGSGSGWTTALLAHIVGEKGQVFGTETIPDLVTLGQEHLARTAYTNASIQQAGAVLGLPKEAPFDRILVSAAAKEVPRELLSQLKDGGIMVLPIGNYLSKVTKVVEDNVEEERHEGFIFVPLL